MWHDLLRLAFSVVHKSLRIAVQLIYIPADLDRNFAKGSLTIIANANTARLLDILTWFAAQLQSVEFHHV